MPRGDGTGPRGMGPMTGRGMGHCAGHPGPGYTHGGRGCCGGRRRHGPGHGMRRGRGHGHGYYGPAYNPYSIEDEVEFLRQQASILEQQLEAVQKRLELLEPGVDDAAEEDEQE